MPIKREYQIDQQWFISHTPVNIDDSTLVENINDMVSYSIAPLNNDVVRVKYVLGEVEQGQLFNIVLRNLTKNSTLRVGAYYNKTLVKMFSDDGQVIASDNILLSRGETKSAKIFLNTDTFNNEFSGDIPITVGVTLNVFHIANGDVVQRDPQMVPLEQDAVVSSIAR